MAEPRWKEVEEQAQAYLEKCRQALEHHQPESMTAQLRGEIKAIHWLLALTEPNLQRDPAKAVQPADPHEFI